MRIYSRMCMYFAQSRNCLHRHETSLLQYLHNVFHQNVMMSGVDSGATLPT